MDRRFALALVPTSSLTACGFDSHEVRQWVLPAKRQSIDTNVDHWVPFVFSEGPLAVTPKIPPDSRSFHVVVLPQVSFGQSARRRLLDVEFDYRSKSIEELAEFELEASFTRLTAPLGSDVDADTLNRALRIAWHRPPLKGDEPVPELISVKGRKWIHFDGSAFESYGTLIDPQTVFFIFGSFWENIRKDPTWFQSRRDLLRLIRDQVVITE